MTPEKKEKYALLRLRWSCETREPSERGSERHALSQDTRSERKKSQHREEKNVDADNKKKLKGENVER